MIVHDAEPDQPGAGAALPKSGRKTAADEAVTASAAATSRERGTINSLAQTVLRVYLTESRSGPMGQRLRDVWVSASTRLLRYLDRRMLLLRSSAAGQRSQA